MWLGTGYSEDYNIYQNKLAPLVEHQEVWWLRNTRIPGPVL